MCYLRRVIKLKGWAWLWGCFNSPLRLTATSPASTGTVCVLAPLFSASCIRWRREQNAPQRKRFITNPLLSVSSWVIKGCNITSSTPQSRQQPNRCRRLRHSQQWQCRAEIGGIPENILSWSRPYPDQGPKPCLISSCMCLCRLAPASTPAPWAARAPSATPPPSSATPWATH
jgi:hypothetical protein